MFYGFEPVFDKDSKILILGSFPSIKSREENFYYGNKQNRFWKTLSIIFNAETGKSKEEKTAFLLNNKIALWDVVKNCDIKGSMDSEIINYEVVDLDKVLEKSKISKIILNGKKAFKIFTDNFKIDGIEIICLPSTSPANVSFDISKWQEALK